MTLRTGEALPHTLAKAPSTRAAAAKNFSACKVGSPAKIYWPFTAQLP
jgi:hypothetical protein